MSRRALAKLFALVMVAVGAAIWVPAPAASGATPVASVEVLQDGREQQFDNFSGAVRAKCNPGYEFQELSFNGVQGSNNQDWSTSAPGFTCNGNWQRISYSSGPGFVAGRSATVTARLTVISTATGDPAPQAVDTGEVWVRRATFISVGNNPTLKPDGTVVVHLQARCDRPWVEPDFSVGINQDNHFRSLPATITCTGALQKFNLRSKPSDGAFHTGAATVDASLEVHDPQSFDPVAATQIFGKPVRIVS